LFAQSNHYRNQKQHDDKIHSGHMYVLWLNKPEERDGLIKHLNSNGIQVSVHYNPVHLEPYYKKEFGYKEGNFPNAEYIGAGAVSLPTYPSLTKEDQDYIANQVVSYFEK
jgi:dTDP-4-amino-4,6-dideoxygalactose transaminase